MGLSIGPSGFAVAGIELLVMRGGAFVSNVTKATGAINTMNGAQEALVRTSVQASRAFKSQAMEASRLTAIGDTAGAARLARANETLIDNAVTRVRKKSTALAVAIAAGMANIVGAGLGVVVRSLRLLADEYERTEIAAVRVAKNQQTTQREFEQTREAITRQAFSAVVAHDAITKLSAAQVDLSNGIRLAAIANDISIARNKDAVQVYDALTDSVARMTTEALEQLDIGVKTTDVFKRYAASLGIVNRTLSDAEKKQAILNEIYRQGAKFAGAFADAQDTVAVQTRRQTAEVDALVRRIGTGLLPVYVRMTRGLRSALRWVSSFNDETLQSAAIVLGVTASLVTMAGAVASLVRVYQLLQPALAVIFAFPWGLILAAVGLLAAGLGIYVSRLNEAKNATDALNKATSADLRKAFVDARNQVTEFNIALVDMQLQAIARQKETIQAGIEGLRDQSFEIKQLLQAIEDEFFQLEIAELKLDKPLFPLIDTLFLVEAQAARVLIPLKRRERALERGLKLLRQQKDEEEERLKNLIKQLKIQIEEQAEIVRLRREELELTQHEAFMEDLRNRIRKQATSGLLLELQSQARVQEDVLARAQEELKTLRDRMKDERNHLRLIQEASEKQLEAAEKQLKAIQFVIDLEEERVRIHKEDLELARANQAQQRLLIEQQRRILQEKEMFTRRDLEISSRAIELLERQVTVLEKLEKQLIKTRSDLELEIIVDTSPLHEVENILDEIKRRMTTEMEESSKASGFSWKGFLDFVRGELEKFIRWTQEKFDPWAAALFNEFKLWWLTKGKPQLIQLFIDLKDELLGVFPDWFVEGAASFGRWMAGWQMEQTRKRSSIGENIRDFLPDWLMIAPAPGETPWVDTVTPENPLGTQSVNGSVGVPSTSMVINNYNTVQGPTVDLTANYADAQSESSIRRDLSDMFEFYR